MTTITSSDYSHLQFGMRRPSGRTLGLVAALAASGVLLTGCTDKPDEYLSELRNSTTGTQANVIRHDLPSLDDMHGTREEYTFQVNGDNFSLTYDPAAQDSGYQDRFTWKSEAGDADPGSSLAIYHGDNLGYNSVTVCRAGDVLDSEDPRKLLEPGMDGDLWIDEHACNNVFKELLQRLRIIAPQPVNR